MRGLSRARAMTLNVPASEMTGEPISQFPMWAEKTRTPLPSATASARFSRPSTSMSFAMSAGLQVEELEDVGHGPPEPAERVPGDHPELGRALFPPEGLTEVGQGDPPVMAVPTEGERPERPAEPQAPGTGEDGEEEHQDLERGEFDPGLHAGPLGASPASRSAASSRSVKPASMSSPIRR